MKLCQSYRNLSIETWRFLETGRRLSHQPLEETITDINIMELKNRHPREVLTETYNRVQEATTGADWQWWFTNSTKSLWYGIRVQAKILKFKTDRFEALNYKNQTDTLIIDANKNTLVPLYCFYAQWPRSTSVKAKKCCTSANVPESYGCSIVDAYTIRANKGATGSDSLASVMANAYPWSCLVCCKGGIPSPDVDLPNRVDSFIDNVVLQGSTDSTIRSGVVDRPPEHVIALTQGEGSNAEPDDPNLSGVVVIIENDELPGKRKAV